MTNIYESIIDEYDKSELAGKIDVYEKLSLTLNYIKENLVKNNSLETLYGFGIDLEEFKGYTDSLEDSILKIKQL